jgi:hypothetical protein
MVWKYKFSFAPHFVILFFNTLQWVRSKIPRQLNLILPLFSIGNLVVFVTRQFNNTFYNFAFFKRRLFR